MTNSWNPKEIACNVSILRTFIEFNSLCISIMLLSFDINEMPGLFFWNGLCPVKDFWIVFFFAKKKLSLSIFGGRWQHMGCGIRKDCPCILLKSFESLGIKLKGMAIQEIGSNKRKERMKKKKRMKNMLHKVITKLIWFCFRQTSMAAHDCYYHFSWAIFFIQDEFPSTSENHDSISSFLLISPGKLEKSSVQTHAPKTLPWIERRSVHRSMVEFFLSCCFSGWGRSLPNSVV